MDCIASAVMPRAAWLLREIATALLAPSVQRAGAYEKPALSSIAKTQQRSRDLSEALGATLRPSILDRDSTALDSAPSE
jgi:hypothetical protein